MREETLGGYIRTVMEQHGLNSNRLAQAAGVTEGTIRNLLKQGDDANVSSPHPLVLRAVSEALHLDPILLFQMAGYLAPDDQHASFSPMAEFVALSFDLLPPEQQKVLLSVLNSLNAANQITLTPEAMRALNQAVRELRKAYAFFRTPTIALKDQIARVVGKPMGLMPEEGMARGIARRFQEVFSDTPPTAFTAEQIMEMVQHPRVSFVLNLLLPRKEIPGALDKLYYLTHPESSFGKQGGELSVEHQEGIKALWRLLEHASSSSL
jgi:transcriptional regulator with XRE-family HTH domain